MSSWASIAKIDNPQKKLRSISVKYNLEKESILPDASDGIPRDRELSPHPADDFTMTNGYIPHQQP